MRSENLCRPLQPQRHPAAPRQPPPDGTLAAASATSPKRPEHHSSTSFYGSVKSPSMHHRSLYLSF